jgi:hypothetical protein
MKKIKNINPDNKVEKIFETLWQNYDSRRRCEKTHLPEFIKKQRTKELKSE